MVKLTDEYIQRRISVEASVSDAYLDPEGNAVIVAANGYGWFDGVETSTVAIVPAGKGAKHFNLMLDQLRPVAVAEDTAEDEELEEIEEDAEDDNA